MKDLYEIWLEISFAIGLFLGTIVSILVPIIVVVSSIYGIYSFISGL